ncbi:hypothetical protein PAXRUDRAFT_19731 [Paxillus rubicundulus Ve08.2h10]|uniref:Uncharacterized protein n=1 Tax=Paxillus rubicundulus Ve08.2h10 TaxID=930991 RepID=A0A0D0DBE8_9AGAM|nr:hypothetical protein PAXRUDRAFT_19731 [Paxillus rubicundulus Ve08.2h10]
MVQSTTWAQSADALAIDVTNLADYWEMKLPQAQVSSASGDDSEPSSDASKVKSCFVKGNLDSHLAQWCIKLQQKYKNEHDEGLTYVGPLGALPLALVMVLDWAHALEEGQATLSMPPNIESFNPVNKVPILHHARRP